MRKILNYFILAIFAFLSFAANLTTAYAFEFPGSVQNDEALQGRLEQAYRAMGADYAPRTHLKIDGDPKYINRLIEQVSPYLIQHAHNPIDWHAWSAEILETAKAENKLIFLSVGYATCHWCHVMERESFDQEDVAGILNESFISIKIDREEYPDLDHLYLTATQLQQSQAGWPNTLWLTPEGKPFHTGTYFTKEELTRTFLVLAEGWRSPSARSDILAVADGLSDQVMQIVGGSQSGSVALNQIVYERAMNALLEKHNEFEGGFSEANQFPQEPYLLFLLDQWRRGGSDEALTAVTTTLDSIVNGGIHDHVGGGFHRYAIDPSWRIPHFEKMLYNQALLSRVLIEAWEATENPSYKRAAKRAFEYVTRDMMAESGAFFAAEDADSENGDGVIEEGAYYVWEAHDLVAGLSGDINIASELTGGKKPSNRDPNILHLDPQGIHDFENLDKSLEQLRALRLQKSKPFKDRKIIAGWNGLMIRSLAIAGVTFDDDTYVQTAARAANVVWNEMWQDGKLSRFLANGKRNGAGLLEDYVWLGLGFVALSDATGEAEWLERSTLLVNAAWERFAIENGRMRQASLDGPLGPIFGAVDDAVPSAESSALELFGNLIHRTGNLRFYSRAEKLASGLSSTIARKPEDLAYALMANRIPLEGESTTRQVRGNGNVHLHLKQDRLILDIKEGWHLSANAPGYDYLIGTKISGAKAEWPKGRKAKLGFATQEAYVYEGRLEIPLIIDDEKLSLTVQACSVQICLAPEEAVFRLHQK